VFLDLNGFRLVAAEQERVATTQQAAASDITEAQWQDWIESAMFSLK
jgi:prophage maintenance system killer protein